VASLRRLRRAARNGAASLRIEYRAANIGSMQNALFTAR